MDDQTQSKSKQNDDEEVAEQRQGPEPPVAGAGGGNWGGWGFSPLSFLSDLQKAANVAAEEISRNVRFETTRCHFIDLFIYFLRSNSLISISELVFDLAVTV